MKQIIIITASLLITTAAFSQNVIPDSVQFYEGKTITVCSKVADTYVSTSEKKITYLNFEYGYPNQTFSGVIFESDLPKFSYVPSEFLLGKKVCVTGKVKIYKGRPEIIINSEEQLKIK